MLAAVESRGRNLDFGGLLRRFFSFSMRNRKQFTLFSERRGARRSGAFALQPEQNRFGVLRRNRGVRSARGDQKRDQGGDQKKIEIAAPRAQNRAEKCHKSGKSLQIISATARADENAGVGLRSEEIQKRDYRPLPVICSIGRGR